MLNGKNFYLGEHDSPESHARYARLITEFIEPGYQTPGADVRLGESPVTVTDVTSEYRQHINDFPATTLTLREFVAAIESQTPLRHQFGHCGNGSTVFWGGDCSFGLHLAPPVATDRGRAINSNRLSSHIAARDAPLSFLRSVPMKTLLDEFHTSFLHAAIYTDGDLRLIVAEGFRAAEPEDVTIAGHVIKGTYAIEPSEESRLVEVRFSRPIAWQLVDESFTASDDYEVRDDKFSLQMLTKSRYLDYILTNHGWFEEIGRGPGKHYRLWTENEVIDIVACAAPTVAPFEGQIGG